MAVSNPAPEEETPDRQLFKQAEVLLKENRKQEAIELLRELRIEYSGSSLVYKSLLMSAKIAVSMDESYKARYHLKKLIAESFDRILAREAAFILADLLFGDYLYDQAEPYYQLGLKLEDGEPDPTKTSGAYLQLAWMAFYHKKDIDLARSYLVRIDPSVLEEKHRERHNTLHRKLLWKNLTPKDIKMEDGNISAIEVDGDDLWIGTWNGGIARYSYSTEQVKIFSAGADSLSDNAIRAIEVGKKRIWVGTYEGLSVYLKATSTWRQIEKLGDTRPGKISLVKEIDGDVYVGTLGKGLWRLSGNRWSRIKSGDFPGDNILSLVENNGNLYIGTMTKGIFLINKNDGKISSFDELTTDLESGNITMLLPDRQNRLWIGTYGKGLYLWDEKKLIHFSVSTGEIKDNWVLCGVETEQGLYFGTFGGGASLFSYADNKWQHIGLREGLSSLDIATISYVKPTVYFGTLGAGITIYTEAVYD